MIMKTLVLYDSLGGNTERVARRIHEVVETRGHESTIVKLKEHTDLDFYDYELVFLGSPVIEWLPTKQMMGFVKRKLRDYRLRGDIPSCAVSVKPGRFAVCFGTNCGAHIGVDEASPMTEWLAAFLGHIGYRVVDKLHLPGEMRNFGQGADWMDAEVFESLNTLGEYGDIRGRPNEEDLMQLEQHVSNMLMSLAT
jgi:hypothetical protein